MARVSVPILVLICVATLLSTAASLAGGLIMYYEGLKSLHDTVVETSKSELDSLRQQLTLPVVSAIDNFEALLYATYAPVFINDNNSSKWVDVVHQQMFSAVRTFRDEMSLGLVVAPREPYSPSALYTALWSEPLKDGSRAYVSASYDESRKEAFSVNNGSVRSPPSLSVPVRMNLLSAENGSRVVQRSGDDWPAWNLGLGERRWVAGRHVDDCERSEQPDPRRAVEGDLCVGDHRRRRARLHRLRRPVPSSAAAAPVERLPDDHLPS